MTISPSRNCRCEKELDETNLSGIVEKSFVSIGTTSAALMQKADCIEVGLLDSSPHSPLINSAIVSYKVFILQTMRVSEIASQIRVRISAAAIRAEDYVSTDNMRSNFGGIDTPSSLPPSGSVTAYQEGDILLSNIRAYFRKTWLATHSGGCNADVLCIRANPEKCLPKYLYYLFTTDNFVNDYLKSCKGAKMPRGNVQRLLDYEFDLPDMPTQLRIAGVLQTSEVRDAA